MKRAWHFFTLNGVETGFLGFDSGGANPPALTVGAGDFVIGVSQRNNGTSMTVTNSFSSADIGGRSGNMNAEAGYLVTPSAGSHAPVFSDGASSAIASFQASVIPEPSTFAMTALASLAFLTRHPRG